MAAPGPWVLTNTTKQKILNDTFNLTTDTFKCALFLSTSNIAVTSTTFAGLTNEVGTTNTGYTAGGAAAAFTVSLVTTDDATVTFTTNPSWTAGSANLTARFAVLYEVSGDVVAYCLLDSTPADVTTTSGQTLTIDSDGTPSPILTLS